MMNIFVGTAGFSYKDWEGVIYPADLKKRKIDPLEYQALATPDGLFKVIQNQAMSTNNSTEMRRRRGKHLAYIGDNASRYKGPSLQVRIFLRLT
jgi:hypothetical protein